MTGHRCNPSPDSGFALTSVILYELNVGVGKKKDLCALTQFWRYHKECIIASYQYMLVDAAYAEQEC